MKSSRRLTILILLAAVVVLAFTGCEVTPTTLTVNILYDDADIGLAPGTYYLYWRLIPQDGTGTPSWSNEVAPYAVVDPVDNTLYRYVLLPDASVLTDAADLYMFDAYLYNADIGVIDPENDPATRVTLAALQTGAAPPFFEPSGHQLTGIEISDGTLKHLHLEVRPDFP